MRRQVGLVAALTILGACATSSGVTTKEAVEIGWEDPDDPAVQQRHALDARPCVRTDGRAAADLAQRVDDWTKVVDCGEPHFLQIIGTVPAPAPDLDREALLDRWSDTYRDVREDGDRACRELLEERTGLATPFGLPSFDDAVLIRPAGHERRAPSYSFFTPAPLEMWELGEHRLVCYVESNQEVTYSITEFVTPGAGVPTDHRRCFDHDGVVPCSTPHAYEVLADVDVTGLVEMGVVADVSPGDDATDVELEEFFMVLGDLCWLVADALSLRVPPDMSVTSWVYDRTFPSPDGSFDMTCQLQPVGAKDLVSGSLFD